MTTNNRMTNEVFVSLSPSLPVENIGIKETVATEKTTAAVSNGLSSLTEHITKLRL